MLTKPTLGWFRLPTASCSPRRRLWNCWGMTFAFTPTFGRAQSRMRRGLSPAAFILRGGGDGLLSPDGLGRAGTDAGAGMGVKRIEANVVGDGSRFADGPYGFGWEWDDFSDEEFPQISGLEVNEGVLERPCRAGQGGAIR